MMVARGVGRCWDDDHRLRLPPLFMGGWQRVKDMIFGAKDPLG